MGYKQNWFSPKHPEKYVGDVNKIFYRSSWELRFKIFLDSNPNVLRWSSEEIAIPYIKPTDGKIHHYYPDYWVEFQNTKGDIIQEIIEVKPLKQAKKPRSKNPRSRLYEDLTYSINLAKWDAARQFCHKYNMEFRILTENSIFR